MQGTQVPHAPINTEPTSEAMEAHKPMACAPQEKQPQWEAGIREEPLLTPTRESQHAARKTQHSQN